MLLVLVQVASLFVMSPSWTLNPFEFEGHVYTILEADIIFGPKYVSFSGALIEGTTNQALPIYGSCYPEPTDSYFCALQFEGVYIRMRAQMDGGGVIQFSTPENGILHTAGIKLQR